MRTYRDRRKYIGSQLKVIFILVLIIFLVLAAVMIFTEWVAKGERRAKIKALQPDKAITLQVDEKDLVLPSPGKLDDSINRPLFMKNRKPYVEPEPEPEPELVEEKEPAEPLTESLVSVIITDKVKVVFLSGGDGTVRLEEGMSYNGWTVAKVHADKVEMKEGDNVEVLELRTFPDSPEVKPKVLGQNPLN